MSSLLSLTVETTGVNLLQHNILSVSEKG